MIPSAGRLANRPTWTRSVTPESLQRKFPGVFDANLNPLYDTDWFKESIQNKLSQNHQLGFSGGNERTQYSLSLNYRDDQGLIKTSYMKRYSGRFTIDDQVKTWLKLAVR